MKISSMAKSNFKGNIYRYIMYIFSNAFSVASFFIFINFLLHPQIDLKKGFGGHQVASYGAVIAVKICIAVIIMFTVFFIYYAVSLFIKSRGKEFGLLSLYGMTKSQIRKYVFIENTIIGLSSIGIGILVGIIFSKLFLMIMERFVEIDLYFNISKSAIIISSLLFFLVFQIINLVTLLKINDKEIVEQIKSSRKPVKLRKYSKVKALIGITLLLLGYFIAYVVTDLLVILAMMPVTFIVILGTYFTITEFSFYLIEKINNNKSIKYNGTNLISYSQLAYKLQDTAKILFLASILGAITFTATETIYTFYKEVDYINGIDTSEDIIIGNFNNKKEHEDFVNDLIVKINDQKDFSIKFDKDLSFLKVNNFTTIQNRYGKDHIYLMSLSDYNDYVEKFGKEKLDYIEDGKVDLVYRKQLGDDSNKGVYKINSDICEISIGDKDFKFKKNKEVNSLGMGNIKIIGLEIFVVNDNTYKEIEKYASEEDYNYVTGIKLNNPSLSYNFSLELAEEYNKTENNKNNFFRIIPHVQTRRSFGLILFVGFFISILFFLASGSIIYFKLFNEVKQDKKEYDILRKIGTTDKEIKKIITKQIGVIFFIPFVISTIHSFFALKALANFIDVNIIFYGIIVMFIYLFFQLIYFLIIRKSYLNKIKYI